jgi:hypothetical protein
MNRISVVISIATEFKQPNFARLLGDISEQ